jgi:outer membrane protein assembly factor BamD (BamD/ComL family)
VLLSAAVYAGEETLMEAAEAHYRSGEFYSAATEAMRCGYLYPKGALYGRSLILFSKALYKSGDAAGALASAEKCFDLYKAAPEGDYGLYLMGRMRLVQSPFSALRNYGKYMDFYGDSLFTEKIYRDRCYGALFSDDFDLSKKMIDEYREKYTNGEYLSHIEQLESDIAFEEARRLKSVRTAVIGSAILPGFGYFYTGNYALGAFSFFTNAFLIAVIADGIIRGNVFQWVFFGLLELSFYQYSIYGAQNSVHEYNSRDKFISRMKLHFEYNFDL